MRRIIVSATFVFLAAFAAVAPAAPSHAGWEWCQKGC
jgi:Spy/CpxP family protein refolding chaperone